MNTTFEKLLTNVYELEGLILVMQRRQGDVPQLILDRFSEKAQQVAEMAELLRTSNQNDVDSHSCNEPEVQPEQDSEPEAQLEQDNEPAPPTNNEPVAENTQPCSQPTETKQEEPLARPVEPERLETTERDMPRDITSAFSINDRFLFQRELFDGDKERYDDAISLMQRQPNIDKIKEFMTDILQWDTSDEVVKEFVRLVELSFKES